MKEWLKLASGAVVTGLIWAGVWAGAGALIGMVETRPLQGVWVGPPIGILPGFVGGVVFCVVLGIAARPRRADESSLLVVMLCGGMVGVLLGVMPLAINEPPGESPAWLVAAVVIGSMTLMSTISATGSMALARGMRAVRSG